MYLQENTVFDLDLDIKVTWNDAQYPLHHVTYMYTDVAASNGLGGDAFTRKYIIWPWLFQIIAGFSLKSEFKSPFYSWFPVLRVLNSNKRVLLWLASADPDGGDRGFGPPLENPKTIGFLSNTGADHQENHKATKPAFNVGTLLARQKNAI